jgi:hypothetical protein
LERLEVLNENLQPGFCQAQPREPVVVIDDLAEACEEAPRKTIGRSGREKSFR